MKKKISISVDESILKNVDFLVDGANIQNRSSAIEYLVRHALRQISVNKAVVLLGGVDISLKPFSSVDDGASSKPLIYHTLMQLKKNGVRDVIFLCSADMSSRLKSEFGDGAEYGLNISHVVEKKPLGSAGALNFVNEFVTEDFFVISGDVYFDFDLEKMLRYHKKNENLATVAVTTTNIVDSKDCLAVEGDKIVSFAYTDNGGKTHLVNAGVYIFSPQVFEFLPERGSLEKSVFPNIASVNKLNCYLFVGVWKHINS